MAIDKITVFCDRTDCFHNEKTWDGYDSYCAKENLVIRLNDLKECTSFKERK